MSKQFSTSEVAEHASVEKGLYIIIDGGVYSMSSFVDEHPGGAKILKRVGGKDASKQFWKVCSRKDFMGASANASICSCADMESHSTTMSMSSRSTPRNSGLEMSRRNLSYRRRYTIEFSATTMPATFSNLIMRARDCKSMKA
jgi:hypothetical protein